MRRKLIAFVAAAPVAVLASGLATSLASGKSSPVPRSGTLVAKIPISTPRDVTSGFGSIWVAGGPSSTVTRIDPGTNKVLAVIKVPNPASVLAVGAGAVWVTSYPGKSVTRIDPRANRARDTITTGGLGAIGITVFDDYVWVANHDREPTGSIAKIDPRRRPMRIVDQIPVGHGPDAGPNWIAAAAGSIWVSVPNLSAVVRIDPHTDSIVATVRARGVCGELVATDHAVWVAGGGGPGCAPAVTRIDPRSNKVRDVLKTGNETDALTLGPGALWYGTTSSNILGRVDPGSDAVLGKLVLPGPSFGASAADGFVWMTDAQDGLLFKVRPG